MERPGKPTLWGRSWSDLILPAVVASRSLIKNGNESALLYSWAPPNGDGTECVEGVLDDQNRREMIATEESLLFGDLGIRQPILIRTRTLGDV